MVDDPGPRVLANDFSRQWEEIRDDASEAIERVGRSGWLVLGEEVESFEHELAEWWGVEHAVGVASGLDALEIALRCADVGPGDRVLTTPLTAFATTLAILRAGAEPVWCDVEESGGLDLDLAERTLRADPSIRALLPVHLYGHPLDGDRLARIATDRGVALIEDCAQSAGASTDGTPTGVAGLAAGTSLYPTKNLGAMGDGGLLLTGDGEVAARARRLRNYGQAEQYNHVEPGLNSRLDELHAAVLRSALLPRLDGWLARRKVVAASYDAALAGGPLRPVNPPRGRSANHLYPVEVVDANPAGIAVALRERGIAVGRHYPVLCPDQPALAPLARTGDWPVARRLAERELSLPIHPFLSDLEVERVIEACAEVVA